MSTSDGAVEEFEENGGDDLEAKSSSYASKYDVLKEIGRGGFGSVFRARNRHTAEECALKIASPSGDDALARHAREVEAQRALQHQHVMPILDAGDGWHTMPLAKTSLKERGPSLYPIEVARMLFDVARGLDAAHQANLLHRDVSPGNILHLGSRWVLGDFGCVRRLASDSDTITVGVVGTPNFAPPEAWSIGTHDIDHRGDICALGRVVRWALTGSPEGAVEAEWRVVDAMTARDRNNRCSLQHVLSLDGALQEQLRNVQRRIFEERGKARTVEMSLEDSALTVLKLVLCLDPGSFNKETVKAEAERRGVSPLEVNLGWMHLDAAEFLEAFEDGFQGSWWNRLSAKGQLWARNHDKELMRSPLPNGHQPSPPAADDIPF